MVTLAMNDQVDRSWRRVGLALDRSGCVGEDRNRAQGLYYVRYSDLATDSGPEDTGKKKGLLDKLKFWGDDEDEKKKDAPKPEPKKDDKGVMDKLKFWDSGEKDKPATELQYRVKLEQAGSGTSVTVLDSNNKLDRSATAGRILSMLYEQLK
jgi:outer membrane protein assembly factor BamC